VPLEDQAATTNNLGLGTPFAGNLEVYPVYRMAVHTGQQETPGTGVGMTRLPSIVRGVLEMPQGRPGQSTTGQSLVFLLDATGRRVGELHPGPNDVSRFGAGVYFVCLASGAGRDASSVNKVVLAR